MIERQEYTRAREARIDMQHGLITSSRGAAATHLLASAVGLESGAADLLRAAEEQRQVGFELEAQAREYARLGEGFAACATQALRDAAAAARQVECLTRLAAVVTADAAHWREKGAGLQVGVEPTRVAADGLRTRLKPSLLHHGRELWTRGRVAVPAPGGRAVEG